MMKMAKLTKSTNFANSVTFALLSILLCTRKNLVKGSILNMTSNLSCSIFHGEDEKTFTWTDNKVHNIDILHLQSNWSPFIKCSLQTNDNSAQSELNVNLLFKTSKKDSDVGRKIPFINGSSSIHFEDDLNNLKEGANLSIYIQLSFANSTQLILEGNLFNLGFLPSFSNQALNQTFSKLVSNIKSWQFHKQSCDNNLVAVVPENISEIKNGFPLGFAFFHHQMTILKWENITIEDVSGVLGLELRVIIKSNVLFMYNSSDLYIIRSISRDNPEGKRVIVFKQEMLPTIQISQILSISLTSKCTVNYHLSWYDLVILVRLSNSSVRVIFGTSPYESWQAYILPDWFSSAESITGQIDFDRQSLFLCANIGQPRRSMVVAYDIESSKQDLVVTSTPFFFDHALQSPNLKLFPKIPAVLLYDESELWLSTDAGHNFRRIFVVKSDDKILQVETVSSQKKELIIVTTNDVLEYSSRGVRKCLIDFNSSCMAIDNVLIVATGDDIINVFCNEATSKTSVSPIELNFDLGLLLIPSLIAEMLNDFEIKLSLPAFYRNIKATIQSIKNICKVSAYPNMLLCEAKIEADNSLIIRSNQILQFYPNCSLVFMRVNNSAYQIHAINIQNHHPCELWTAGMIGQSLILLQLQTTCWIQWLLDNSTAFAICKEKSLIAENKTFDFTNFAIFDSRGDERCEKRSMTLVQTNSSKIFEITPAPSLFSNMSSIRQESYLRFNESFGSISIMEDKVIFTLLGDSDQDTAYDYMCIVTKQTATFDNVPLSSGAKKSCQLEIAYEGLKADEIFLDANDETEFNVTLSKSIKDNPYTDEIPPLAIQPIEPSHVKLQIKSYLRMKPMVVRVVLKQKPYSSGTSLLSIYSTVQPTHCIGSHKKVTIHGACPPGKHLSFEYPMNFDKETWLRGNPKDHDDFTRIATIPYNYQPPSRLGKAIPLTPNIYNADPSKPMHRASYKVSRDIATFKHCQGKMGRAYCGCTLDMTISPLPEDTDCFQRAYKVYFMEKFIPHLYIVNENSERSRLVFPYCITEINDRKDYTIENKVSSGCMAFQKNSSLKFDGSGLFHFQVKVSKAGYTFCDLETYFVLFVADAPMPYPAQELVRAMTSFCFGSIILSAFLLNYHLN